MKRQAKVPASLKRIAASKRRTASKPWLTVEEFLHNGGNIQLGSLGPHGPSACAAVASDDSSMLVGLARDRHLSLHRLLDRLEASPG